MLKQITTHLTVLKSLCASEELLIEDDVQQLLFHKSFATNLKQELAILTPIWEIISESRQRNLIWATDKILRTQSPLIKFANDYNEWKIRCLTPQGLLGVFLSSKEKGLLTLYMRRISDFVMEFKNPPLTTSYIGYRRDEHIFTQCAENNLSYIDFWDSVAEDEDHGQLAELAKKLWNLPASCCITETPDFDESLSDDVVDKMLLIYIDAHGNADY